MCPPYAEFTLATGGTLLLFIYGFLYGWWLWGGIVGIWLSYFTYVEPIWPDRRERAHKIAIAKVKDGGA